MDLSCGLYALVVRPRWNRKSNRFRTRNMRIHKAMFKRWTAEILRGAFADDDGRVGVNVVTFPRVTDSNKCVGELMAIFDNAYDADRFVMWASFSAYSVVLGEEVGPPEFVVAELPKYGCTRSKLYKADTAWIHWARGQEAYEI